MDLMQGRVAFLLIVHQNLDGQPLWLPLCHEGGIVRLKNMCLCILCVKYRRRQQHGQPRHNGIQQRLPRIFRGRIVGTLEPFGQLAAQLAHAQHLQEGAEELGGLFAIDAPVDAAGGRHVEAVPEHGGLQKAELGIPVGGAIGADALVDDMAPRPLSRLVEKLKRCRGRRGARITGFAFRIRGGQTQEILTERRHARPTGSGDIRRRHGAHTHKPVEQTRGLQRQPGLPAV
ncbi:MAG: hypothetical protein R2854_01000 [Caldilineaceae bacterium]